MKTKVALTIDLDKLNFEQLSLLYSIAIYASCDSEDGIDVIQCIIDEYYEPELLLI